MPRKKGTKVRKPKRAGKNDGKPASPKRGQKLTPRQRVRKAQEKVLKEMNQIVGKMCDSAKQGNHSAAKFAFDFARIPELQSPLEETKSQESLASLLLDKLKPAQGSRTSAEEDTSSTVE